MCTTNLFFTNLVRKLNTSNTPLSRPQAQEWGQTQAEFVNISALLDFFQVTLDEERFNNSDGESIQTGRFSAPSADSRPAPLLPRSPDDHPVVDYAVEASNLAHRILSLRKLLEKGRATAESAEETLAS